MRNLVAMGIFLPLLGAVAIQISCSSNVYGQTQPQRVDPEQNRPIGTVTIYRDEWGVPHMYSDREEDGFYGLGYAQAQDRLEGLLKRFLAVRGEAASVFGTSEVENDFRNLQWMHLEEARSGFHRLEPRLQKDYQYFIDGIKRYMRDHPKEVPTWAPPLEPALPVAFLDSLLWGINDMCGIEHCRAGGIAVAFGSVQDQEMAGGLSVASNEWVVMPWRTSGNAVIDMADSHVPFEGELRAFEFRMHAGDLAVSGFSGDGLVLPVTAHNRNVAWGMTMGGPNVADCYAVDVDHNNPRRYLFDGKWREMTTRRFTVQVKGGAPVTREFDYTDHNGVPCPVVARRGDTAYVISSPYMHQTGLLDEQLYRMDLSRNMNEFRKAMSLLGMFQQNVMAGSTDGHILYVRAGRVPIRPSGYDFHKPVPGNTSATLWRGIHPFEDLVVLEDPVAGYMTNNNVSPDMMTEGRSIDAARYSDEAFYDLPGYTNARGRRVIQVLSRSFAFSKTDAMELAFDEKWEGADAWIEALRTTLSTRPDFVRAQSPAFRRFADRILNFDGFAHKESIGALDYLYWRMALGDEQAGSLAEAIEAHKDLTPSQRDVLTSGLAVAITKLTAEHGTTEVRLGDVYRIGRGGESWPIGGVKFYPGGVEVTTLRAMLAEDPDSKGLRWVYAGQRQPVLTILTNPIQSFTSAPYGQSDRPESLHYSDQAQLVSEGRLKPSYFNKEDLMNHVSSSTLLTIDNQDVATP
jgi:acyl-homoserine-lactone acylase